METGDQRKQIGEPWMVGGGERISSRSSGENDLHLELESTLGKVPLAALFFLPSILRTGPLGGESIS